MSLCGGMIVLNEEQYIEATLRQHYDWLDQIVIIEGADVHYPRRAVTREGLSTDRTAEFIRSFPDPGGKITFLQVGWMGDGREGHGKTLLRDLYAAVYRRRNYRGWLWHMDADEFFLKAEQPTIRALLEDVERAGKWAVRLPTVHFWKDTSQIATGGYYNIDHVRFFRFRPEMSYHYIDEGSHNWPRFATGIPIHRHGLAAYGRKLIRCVKALPSTSNEVHDAAYDHDGPCCYHFGFTKGNQAMRDKTEYYENRGESVSRPRTIADRRAWFGDSSENVQVLPWCGQVPEVFHGRA